MNWLSARGSTSRRCRAICKCSKRRAHRDGRRRRGRSPTRRMAHREGSASLEAGLADWKRAHGELAKRLDPEAARRLALRPRRWRRDRRPRSERLRPRSLSSCAGGAGLSGAPIAGETEAGEAEQHHGPGRGLGNHGAADSENAALNAPAPTMSVPTRSQSGAMPSVALIARPALQIRERTGTVSRAPRSVSAPTAKGSRRRPDWTWGTKK